MNNNANNQGPNGDRRVAIEKLAAQLAQLLAEADVKERLSLEAWFVIAVQQALARINGGVDAKYLGLKSPPLTPELREWLRHQFSEDEIAIWLQDFKEKGGVELSDFLPELEQIVSQP